jgi:hypothetical protein
MKSKNIFTVILVDEKGKPINADWYTPMTAKFRKYRNNLMNAKKIEWPECKSGSSTIYGVVVIDGNGKEHECVLNTTISVGIQPSFSKGKLRITNQ